MGADTSQAEAGLAKVGRSVTQMAGSAARTLGIAGAGMTAAITAPLVALGSQALSSAADFEQSMNILASVANIPAQSLEHLQRQALNLGAQTSFSAGEAAEAMLELGKAGMDMFEISASISGVLDLAAAGGIGLAEAATVTSAALNTFGLEASESARVANLLAGAANASAADMSDLALSATQAGQGFALTNQPIEDMVTSIALLANVGQSGSKAGTNLNQAMQRLINPTVKAKKQMKELGVNVFDSSGEMLSMTEIIDEFNTGLAGLTDQQKATALSTIFMTDGMQAMVPLLEAGSAGFAEMREQVTQEGQSSSAAAARMSGLSGAIEYLKGSVDSFLIGAALPFMDFVGDIARGIADLISSFGRLPAPVRNAALAFAGVLAAAGPIVGAMAAVAGAFALLGTAAAPILAVTAALAGLAAAVAGGFLPIPGFVTNAISSLQTFGAELANILATGEGVAELGDLRIKVTPEYTTIQVGDLIEGIWTPDYATIDVANIITGIWTPDYTRIAVKDLFTGTFTPEFTKIEIADALGLTLTTGGQITVAIGAEQFDFDLTNVISTMQIKIATFVGLIQAAFTTGAWLNLGQFISDQIAGVLTTVTDFVTLVMSGIDMSAVAAKLSGAVTAVSDAIQGLASPENLGAIGTSIGSLGATIITKLTELLSAPGFAEDVGTAVQGATTALVNGAAALTEGIVTELSTVNWGAFAASIDTFVTNFVGGVAAGLVNADYSGVASAIVEGMSKAIGELILQRQEQLVPSPSEIAEAQKNLETPGPLRSFFPWLLQQTRGGAGSGMFAPGSLTPRRLTEGEPFRGRVAPVEVPVTGVITEILPPEQGPPLKLPEFPLPKLQWPTMEEMMRQIKIGASAAGGVGRVGGDIPMKAVIVEATASPTLKPIEVKALFSAADMAEAGTGAGAAISKGAAMIGSTLSGFQWPALPSWEWPALPVFTWPPYPQWTWPPIPAPAWLDRLVVPRPTWLGELLSWSPQVVVRQQATTVPGQNTTASAGEGRVGTAAMSAGGGVTITGDVYVRDELDLENLAYRISQIQNRRS